MKVYVIQMGIYSDRHVIGVVETKEEADKVCQILRETDRYDSDSADYIEYDTHQFNTKQMRFIVEYRYDDWNVEYDDYDLYNKCKENICDYEDHYIIYANSPQQAIKIAQDMKAQMKAEKANII